MHSLKNMYKIYAKVNVVDVSTVRVRGNRIKEYNSDIKHPTP